MSQSGIPPLPPPPSGNPGDRGGAPTPPPRAQVPNQQARKVASQKTSVPNPSTRLDNATQRQQTASRIPQPGGALKPPPPGPPPSMPSIPLVVNRNPGQPSLEQLVRDAFEQGCSDLHLGVNEQVRFRQRGIMMIQEQYPVTDEQTFYAWMHEVMEEKLVQQFKETMEYDGAAQYEYCRCRINIFESLRGPALVMRIIPLKILTLDQLNLPEVFRELCYTHRGLILVTGPTGSGKSTTMAAMVDFINAEMAKNIISIEDPIEFVHKSKKSLVKQREVGIHTVKFDNALKASLREDPDIILIGEMRDRETVNTALKAGQTGHLVFGTLHTNSAIKTIERILNLYEPDQQGPMRDQLAETMVAVIAQTLVRTTDGKRAAVHEIMINTDAIRDYIKRNEVDEIESIIPKSTFDGMVSMNQSLYKLYEEGRITEETAVENSPKPNEMAQYLRGRL
ncbi:twitching motility protein [Thalassoporum mexicanum PCC 7367]|uniref:type IV pilus twitching motility protein PilT n=1 Tax=Thalassoporum mexicanum TaxID=3457544 RepID=UPI00029F9E80|nr:type IV pilus twitching motility protein PilT [Pseudanabaena sp. PCC 7367]AFY70032.1 twitching motility protein [Pseudanabaena sp. PCC 7367]